MKKGTQSATSFHLAGVIPVHGQETDFDFPWHPCLMPIDNGFTLLHRSIVECAYAGCETIWVVCNDDIAPLVKMQVGDYMYDPKYYYRDKSPLPFDEQKMIPIYYVPIHPNDRRRRDSLGWAALYGAYSSYLVAKRLSEWIIPDRYYISFPYGIYSPYVVSEHRKAISSKSGFFLRHSGKIVKDNKYLGFTIDAEDFIECRKDVRKNATLLYKKEVSERGLPREKLPKEQRYSGRYFGLSQVFNKVREEGAKYVDVSTYNPSVTWDEYKEYFKNEELVIKPKGKWFVNNRYRKSLLYLDEFKEDK